MREHNILVFNCGSSSLSFKVFDCSNPEAVKVVLSGKGNRVGVKGTEPSSLEIRYNDKARLENVQLENHRIAASLVIQYLKEYGIPIHAVGHRFAHGGGVFQRSVFIEGDVLEKLRLCQPLAPIHNPASLSVIYESYRLLPGIPQFAAFDSAFHASIPEYAYTYALPRDITENFGFRKYGFHGLSYQYVLQQLSRVQAEPLNKLKIIICHLGTGGASVVAIQNGKSIDTSMGYSPLSGLIMSTRCGDIDPMLGIYLMNVYGYRSDEVIDLFDRRSGLLGVSGLSSDIRDIIHNTSPEEQEQSDLAFDMYIHRLKKYIGSFCAILGGVDVLAFTDDIGVKNWLVREKACEGMEWCGLKLDREANMAAVPDANSLLSKQESATKIFCIPNDEELVICMEGIKLEQEKCHDANL